MVEKKSGLPASTDSARNRASIAISPSPFGPYLSTSILDNDTGNEVSHIYKSTDAAESWADLAALAPTRTLRSVATWNARMV